MFLKSEKLTVIAFENSIGASNSYVNSILNSIGLKKLEKIAEVYPHLNLEWLLLGIGTIYKSNNTINGTIDVHDSSHIELLESNQKLIAALQQVIVAQSEKIELLESNQIVKH